MARVLITRPNAGEENNGIKFQPHEGGGMISEEIDAELAAVKFPIGTPGYELVDGEGGQGTQTGGKTTTKKTTTKKTTSEQPPADTGGQQNPLIPEGGEGGQGTQENGGNGND